MKIYIPSYRRWKTVGVDGTLTWLPDYWHQDTIVAVDEDELDYYRTTLAPYFDSGLTILVCPANCGIAEKRRLIGLDASARREEHFVTMDDDLVFAKRWGTDTTSLVKCDESDMAEMLGTMRDHLERYAHVVISLRQGNNNAGPGPSPLLAECGRGIRCVAYRTREFNECQHARVRIMEDIDITLQLLTRGYANAILYWWAQDQKATNAPGGCSVWRTHEVQDMEARKLHQIWPQFTKPREKKNKSGGDFGTRTELTVFWKSAYQSSQR